MWGYKPGKRERVICRLGYVRVGVLVGVPGTNGRVGELICRSSGDAFSYAPKFATLISDGK